MKKIIMAIACWTLGFLAMGQGYTVKARIDNAAGYTFYLSYQENGRFVLDTAHAKNGWIIFQGKVSAPRVASLGMRKNPALQIELDDGITLGPGLTFFLTNETITIKGDANTVYMASVQGGKQNEEWSAIKAEQDRLVHERWTSFKEGCEQVARNGDSTLLKKAGRVRTTDDEKDQALQKDFIQKYPHSLVSMYFLSNMVNSLEVDELERQYNKLGITYKSSEYGKSIAEKITNAKATAIGQKALPFSGPGKDGKLIRSSTLKGKYVLIDFWGSWCGACRQGHPHMKEMYALYKDRGFEMVGIATENGTAEQKKKTWLSAIAQDGLTWIQVLNDDSIDNVVRKYGVTAFPTRVLIDPQGIILGRWVGEEYEAAIDAKLAGVMPARKAVTIKAHIRGLKDSVKIGWSGGQGYRTEKVPVTNETFQWSGSFSEPEQVNIGLSTGEFQTFVDSGEVSIEGRLEAIDSLTITGSPTQTAYHSYNAGIFLLQQIENAAYDTLMNRKGGSEADPARIERRIDSIKQLIDRYNAVFISQHPSSAVGISIIIDMSSFEDYTMVDSLYQLLAPTAQNTVAGKALRDRMAILERSRNGATMQDFSETDVNGKTVHLSDFKGKYVLVDFWASWCGPCRAENPNVLKAYNRYKDKNFTVLGVALDNDAQKWKQAVKEDQMPWTEVSDLKGWRNEVATYYGIDAIPCSFLIDPNGKILAKRLRGMNLQNYLAEILQ